MIAPHSPKGSPSHKASRTGRENLFWCRSSTLRLSGIWTRPLRSGRFVIRISGGLLSVIIAFESLVTTCPAGKSLLIGNDASPH